MKFCIQVAPKGKTAYADVITYTEIINNSTGIQVLGLN